MQCWHYSKQFGVVGEYRMALSVLTVVCGHTRKPPQNDSPMSVFICCYRPHYIDWHTLSFLFVYSKRWWCSGWQRGLLSDRSWVWILVESFLFFFAVWGPNATTTTHTNRNNNCKTLRRLLRCFMSTYWIVYYKNNTIWFVWVVVVALGPQTAKKRNDSTKIRTHDLPLNSPRC